MVTEMLTPQEAFDMYRPLVEDNEQAVPILLYGTDEGAACLVIVNDDNDDMELRDVLNSVLTHAKDRLGAARWLIFSAECSVRGVARDERGEFTVVDEQVLDCVSIVGVSPSKGWQQFLGFTRDEGGVEWGGPHDACGGPEGPIADVLLAAVR